MPTAANYTEEIFPQPLVSLRSHRAGAQTRPGAKTASGDFFRKLLDSRQLRVGQVVGNASGYRALRLENRGAWGILLISIYIFYVFRM
jgi:hypothetical protein